MVRALEKSFISTLPPRILSELAAVLYILRICVDANNKNPKDNGSMAAAIAADYGARAAAEAVMVQEMNGQYPRERIQRRGTHICLLCNI